MQGKKKKKEEEEETLGGGWRRRGSGKDSGILFPFPIPTSLRLLPGSPCTVPVVEGGNGLRDPAMHRVIRWGAGKKAEHLGDGGETLPIPAGSCRVGGPCRAGLAAERPTASEAALYTQQVVRTIENPGPLQRSRLVSKY